MSKYSLDEENKRRYDARARDWKAACRDVTMPAEEPITVPIPVENANISGIIKLGQERRGLNIDLQFFAEKDIKNKALYHYKGLFVNFERVLKNMKTRLTIRNNSIRIGIRLTNDTK